MDWIVTTARTVEEAQTRALDLLGVDNADAEVQVIEEGKTGLFGRTKSEARVRARIKPKAPPAKEERRPSRGGDRNRNRGGGGGKGGQNKGRSNRDSGGGSNNNRDGGNRDGGNRDGGGRNRNRGGNRDGGGAKEAVAAGAVASGSKDSNRDGGNRDGGGRDGGNRDGGGRSRNRGGNRDGGNRDGGNRDGGSRDGGGRNRNRGGGRGDGGNRNNEDRVEMPVEEQRETLEAFVTGVAKGFDSDAKVTLVEEGTTLLAQVHGGDLGRLIGNKASTLQSLEELSRTAMHRAAAGRRYHRIQVDVDDYRARRREALAKFAQDLARSVADSGESKAMEPMGAADRKLIHDAVADIAGVETVSEGRDPRRYIVLLATDAVSDEEE